jgi:hypothetical protein
MLLFSFCPQAIDVGEMHSLLPGTVHGTDIVAARWYMFPHYERRTGHDLQTLWPTVILNRFQKVSKLLVIP